MVEKTPQTIKELLIVILIITIVIAIGMFAVNQTLGYYYKSQFLQSPCQLCKDVNPHLEKCFKDASIVYKDLEGNIISKEELNKYEINLSNINISRYLLQD
jgi:hypothetical protein